MAEFTEERIQELNQGYNLDCGGYSWENLEPDHPLFENNCVLWEEPDLDYFPFFNFVPADCWGCCAVMFFAPREGFSSDIPHWPTTFKTQSGVWRRQATATTHETDRECHCHGELVPWTGAAGEPRKPMSRVEVQACIDAGHCVGVVQPESLWDEGVYFKHTGDRLNRPYPACTCCQGDGYVISHGGYAAYYTLEE